MKTLLKNANIYDGSGHEPCVGSILMEHDKIMLVAYEIEETCADVVFDVWMHRKKGLV